MQTNYATSIRAFVAGLILDMAFGREIATRASAESSAQIGYGLGVVHQDGDSTIQVRRPTAANWNGIVEGITCFVQVSDTFGLGASQVNTGTALNGQYTAPIQPGGEVNALKKGVIAVVVEDTPTKGSPVYMRVTANGGNTTLGAFRTDSDSGNAVEVQGAVFEDGPSNGLAPLRFDFDAQNASVQALDRIQPLDLILVNVAATGNIMGVKAPFSGRIIGLLAKVKTAVTTASKKLDLGLKVNSTAVTGGVIALTSAAATPVNKALQGSAVTGTNTFSQGDTLYLTAADPAAGGSLTAFAEGELEVTIVVSQG